MQLTCAGWVFVVLPQCFRTSNSLRRTVYVVYLTVPLLRQEDWSSFRSFVSSSRCLPKHILPPSKRPTKPPCLWGEVAGQCLNAICTSRKLAAVSSGMKHWRMTHSCVVHCRCAERTEKTVLVTVPYLCYMSAEILWRRSSLLQGNGNLKRS